MRKATIKQKRPIASDKAKPRMAYEKSCCFRDGFLAYPMIRLPKTVPIPAPDPATPTVAAPAPMNLAAESMSFFTGVTCNERERMAAETGLMVLHERTREGDAVMILEQYIFKFNFVMSLCNCWWFLLQNRTVCVLGHFFRISLAQLLLLRQAAFFPPAQLLENLRQNKINKQKL